MAEAGGGVDPPQVEFGEGLAGGAQGEQAGPDGAAVAGSFVDTMPLSTMVSMWRQRSASKISSTTRSAVCAMTEAYWDLTCVCGRRVSVTVSEVLT